MLCISVCLGLVTGCGESRIPTYPIVGKVVFDDGTPVRTGTVEFSSVEHALTATGTIRDDGSFVVGTYDSKDGACAGEHSVIVMQLIVNDGTVKHSMDHGKPVDPVFASYNTSPLTAKVAAREENAITLTVTPSREVY
ncbi:MAG: carboxypeptidase regulatory-like domain-containing protein [Planctomycetaceae bacterium]|nr:carboxypeptidase regulatory-like domain-containing protein [Planctomycetaceae bacterium]MCA9065663.1 carboxypeptidase regulatory-like domain-containing protein [Planctomycetaceae bacterium]